MATKKYFVSQFENQWYTPIYFYILKQINCSFFTDLKEIVHLFYGAIMPAFTIIIINMPKTFHP